MYARQSQVYEGEIPCGTWKLSVTNVNGKMRGTRGTSERTLARTRRLRSVEARRRRRRRRLSSYKRIHLVAWSSGSPIYRAGEKFLILGTEFLARDSSLRRN